MKLKLFSKWKDSNYSSEKQFALRVQIAFCSCFASKMLPIVENNLSLITDDGGADKIFFENYVLQTFRHLSNSCENFKFPSLYLNSLAFSCTEA